MTEQLTVEDLRKASELVKKNTPCYCKYLKKNNVPTYHCPKHPIIKITKKQRNDLLEVILND